MPKHNKIEAEIQQVTQEKTKVQALQENDALAKAHQRLKNVERAPLRDRQAAKAEFLEYMKRDPKFIAASIESLLEGHYGHGEMLLARRILSNRQMNRMAALTHLSGAIDFKCPHAMAIAAWKKLTKLEQALLDQAVQRVIDQATAAGFAE